MGLFSRFRKENEFLVFEHLPFKLAVLQRLMYDLKLLGDQYTGGDAYFEQYADAAEVSEEESIKRLEPYIRRGWQFFREFRIPASLAEKVTHLYLGAENEIYYQINPQWLDFDETFQNGADFDVMEISERELRQFPALKSITFNLCHEPPVELVRQLRAWGVEVNGLDG